MPGSTTIRSANLDDYDAFLRLVPELGVGDPRPSRERFAEDLVHRMIVATAADAVIGYALYEILASDGYVRNIVTDPAHRRGGVGLALMDEMRDRFARAGASEWCLNVKPQNTAAIALYERCGLRPAYRSWVLRVPREAVLPSPPPDLSVAPVRPGEDQEVERAFRLLRGQLASARAQSSRTVLKLARGKETLGVGVFAESFPGAFPFRLIDPAFGAAFVAHLRMRVPGAAFVQLGIEDDEALQAALLALGARVHLELQHMRGPL